MFTVVGVIATLPSKKSMTCLMFFTPRMSRPCTMAASRAFCSGSISAFIPRLRASSAMGNAPRMGCRVPSNDNSPII